MKEQRKKSRFARLVIRYAEQGISVKAAEKLATRTILQKPVYGLRRQLFGGLNG